MANITLRGNQIHTCGALPAVGSRAPEWILTDSELADRSPADFSGKTLVLNIFPSLDTPVCATSVRRFNAEAAARKNVAVLCISLDLPFAHKRFCSTEGLEAVTGLSELRQRTFGEAYGVRIIDGPLAGLLARAVVVVDPQGIVRYTELVPEIAQEPDYAAALAAIGV
ncbi:MAG TPA: thiol peroxidase [Spirochaetota bacterium]|nr:thiol peroxidase [Spirochaetota bacterium]